MTSMITQKTHQETAPISQKKAVLDQETANFLNEFAKLFASLESLPIPEQRSSIRNTFQIPPSALEKVEKVENKTISSRHGPVPIRFFYPSLEKNLPILVFLHKGGWVYGNVDESETICRKLANLTGTIVASVEYRLSPEHKFPIPVDDCYDASHWIAKNCASLNANPEKIILCGESAGGGMAAAVTQMARDSKDFNIAGELLLYPVLTGELDPQRYEQSPDKALLNMENMQFFLGAYMASPEDRENPYAFPLKNKNLSHLPPSFIMTAEYDALKTEGAEYGESLQASGVDVITKCYPGVVHGFLEFPLAEKVKQEAFADIQAWVKNL